VLESHGAISRLGLGAVVVLNAKGRARLGSSRRAALATALRNHLRKSFDASTLPRSFRFVGALPRDAQGKISQAALVSLFRTHFDPSVTAPQRLRETQGKTRLRLRLKVPKELAYLDGHFPQHPIVPGIVQLRWVVEAAARWLGRRVTVRRMEAVKFKNLLLPGKPLVLVVERDASGAGEILRFSLTGKQTSYSSGRLVLA